jgi:hypothetical protein
MPLSPWGAPHAGALEEPRLAPRGAAGALGPRSVTLPPDPFGAVPPPVLPPGPVPFGIATTGDPFTDVTLTLADGTRVKHQARVANATADLREATSIANTRETIERQPYRAQLDATRALYNAIGAFYRDANVIPQSDPVYAQWWLDWFVGNGPGSTAGFNAVTKVDSRSGAWGRVNGVGAVNVGRQSPGPSEFETRTRQQWERMGRTLIDSLHDFCGFRMRFMLDDQGTLIEQCLNYGLSDEDSFGRRRQIETDCVDWSFTGQVEDGATAEGHPETDARTWRTFLWSKKPEIGIPAGNWCALDDVLAPVRWFFDAAIDLSQRIANRPRDAGQSAATATWLAAIVYSTLWNLRTADELGVLPADLAALAANLPRNVTLSQLAAQQSNLDSAIQFSQVAMQVGSYAGPYGTAFAALASAVAIAISALPAAVATSVDYFGRDLPFSMRIDMQGETEVTPPTRTNRRDTSDDIRNSTAGDASPGLGVMGFALLAMGAAIALGGGKHGL